MSSPRATVDGQAFLVQNPDDTSMTSNVVASTDDAPGTSPLCAPTSAADFTLGTLQDPPNDDPYNESDRAVAKERHALDMQYQVMTKGYQDADGTILKEVDAQMEAVHKTYESYNAAGANSVALKEEIAKQDAEVKARIERHAGGAPLLNDANAGLMKHKANEAEDFLRRMAELDAATKRAVADNDKTIEW